MSNPVPDFDIDLSADFLEDTILDGSPACEARHDRIGVKCSGEVTHRFMTSCGEQKSVCLKTAEYVLSEVSSTIKRCSGCGTLTHRCWRIFPI